MSDKDEQPGTLIGDALDQRLPTGWKVAKIETNDIVYTVTLFQPGVPQTTTSVKEGQGPSIETAFLAALNQILNRDVYLNGKRFDS